MNWKAFIIISLFILGLGALGIWSTHQNIEPKIHRQRAMAMAIYQMYKAGEFQKLPRDAQQYLIKASKPCN